MTTKQQLDATMDLLKEYRLHHHKLLTTILSNAPEDMYPQTLEHEDYDNAVLAYVAWLEDLAFGTPKEAIELEPFAFGAFVVWAETAEEALRTFTETFPQGDPSAPITAHPSHA